MKKTKENMQPGEAYFAFIPEDESSPRTYIKQLKAYEPEKVEEVGPMMASIGEIFEKMMADARIITVGEYMGFPSFPAIENLNESEIENELKSALALMETHHIKLDTLINYPDEDIYRFIIEELMFEEMEDVRMKDTFCHFQFEDFHDREEVYVQEAIVSFIYQIFSSDKRFLNYCLSENFTIDQKQYNPLSKKEFLWALQQEYIGWEPDEITLDIKLLDDNHAMTTLDVQLQFPGTELKKNLENMEIHLLLEDEDWKVKKVQGLFR